MHSLRYVIERVKVLSISCSINEIGLQIYMFFHSCYLLLNSKEWSRTVKFYVIYGLINLVLTAFSLAGNMHVGQLMWIEHPDFPGGPLAYYANNIFWITILGNAAIIAGNYRNDALLVLCSFFLRRIYSLTFSPGSASSIVAT